MYCEIYPQSFVRDYKKISQRHGDEAALKELLQTAHEMDIPALQDLVTDQSFQILKPCE